MTKFTWRGYVCLIVPPIQGGRCTGCLFDGPNECPHTSDDTDITCNVGNDVIFIADTPEALADYAAKKLEGT